MSPSAALLKRVLNEANCKEKESHDFLRNKRKHGQNSRERDRGHLRGEVPEACFTESRRSWSRPPYVSRDMDRDEGLSTSISEGDGAWVQGQPKWGLGEAR